MPWAAAATVIGAGITAVTSSNAADTAASAASDAATQNTALARETRDIITNQVQPWVQPGAAANNMLAARVMGGGQPTSPPAPATAVPPPSANPLANYAVGGGNAGTSPLAPATGAPGGHATDTFVDPRTGLTPGAGSAPANPLAAVAAGGSTATGAPTAPGGHPDWGSYLQQNPDVLAAYNDVRAKADPNSPFFTEHGLDSPEHFAAWHWQTYGQNEVGTPGTVRVAPPGVNAPPTAPATAPPPAAAPDPSRAGLAYGQPSGLTEPTFGPRDATARPNVGAAPSYDFSAGAFQASPDYAFRQQEAVQALNNYYGAKGALGGGGAIKAILDRASNLASGEYGNWFGRQLERQQADRGQYNTDAARTDTNFNVDRSVGDARFDADRGFQYGNYLDKLNYGTGRFDTQNNDLFKLSGQGLAGVGTVAGANTNALGVIANSNNQRADAIGGAAISNANTVANLAGQGLQAVGTYYGLRNGGSPSLPAQYHI